MQSIVHNAHIRVFAWKYVNNMQPFRWNSTYFDFVFFLFSFFVHFCLRFFRSIYIDFSKSVYACIRFLYIYSFWFFISFDCLLDFAWFIRALGATTHTESTSMHAIVCIFGKWVQTEQWYTRMQMHIFRSRSSFCYFIQNDDISICAHIFVQINSVYIHIWIRNVAYSLLTISKIHLVFDSIKNLVHSTSSNVCSCENIFNIFPFKLMDQLNDPIFQALDAAVAWILVGISK